MLVLSRGPSDKIVFPTLDILVEILRITSNRVRIGIHAPREVPVLRHELEPHAVTESAAKFFQAGKPRNWIENWAFAVS